MLTHALLMLLRSRVASSPANEKKSVSSHWASWNWNDGCWNVWRRRHQHRARQSHDRSRNDEPPDQNLPL